LSPKPHKGSDERSKVVCNGAIVDKDYSSPWSDLHSQRGGSCFLVVGDKGEILTCCEKYVVRSHSDGLSHVNAKDRDIGTLGRDPLYLSRDLFMGKRALSVFPDLLPRPLWAP